MMPSLSLSSSSSLILRTIPSKPQSRNCSRSSSMTIIIPLVVLVVVAVATTTSVVISVSGFSPIHHNSHHRPITASAAATTTMMHSKQQSFVLLYNTKDDTTGDSDTTSVFVPIDSDDEETDDEEEDDDDVLDKVELFGKGAAKAKRGKRKGGSSTTTKTPVNKAALVPEEVFYEGPPAVSETFLPTLSILTVVGIIPAAAAWARQAWVRYKITNRRIRVNSGINGNDMCEIIYSDIIEIRTVKRLFGDGDMVCNLRDGAKFEMRNIPNFDTTLEFILQQCNDDVVELYRSSGDVGRG